MLYPCYSRILKIFDILFPPNCTGCGMTAERFCYSCLNSATLCTDSICEICGDLVSMRENGLCDRCDKNTPYFASIRSWALYDGALRKAIRCLKYKKDFGIGEILVAQLVVLLNKQTWKIDLITAVPLAQNRIRERGYNQSNCLAIPLAYFSNLPYSTKLIWRIRATRSQVGLSYSERRSNVENAFEANPDLASGRSVLLVDDVITTCATINSCAKSLINAGALKVFGISLARASRLLSE